jgi:hypothetical protein
MKIKKINNIIFSSVSHLFIIIKNIVKNKKIKWVVVEKVSKFQQWNSR